MCNKGYGVDRVVDVFSRFEEIFQGVLPLIGQQSTAEPVKQLIKRGDYVVATKEATKGYVQKAYKDTVKIFGVEKLAPTKDLIITEPKLSNDKNYVFFTSCANSIDFTRVAKDLTTENPLAIIKGTRGTDIILIKTDLIVKACTLGSSIFTLKMLEAPTVGFGFVSFSVDEIINLGGSIKDFVEEAKRILATPWGTPEALIEVNFLNLK